MNEPKRRFFSGDSLQQALIQAANHYNLAPEEIAYQAIEKRHGFTKVRRKVMIEVNPDAPRKEKTAAAARPAAPPPPPPKPLTPAFSESPSELAAPSRRQVESPVLDRPVLDRPAESRIPEIKLPESRLAAEPVESVERPVERVERNERPREDRDRGPRREGDRGPRRERGGERGRGPAPRGRDGGRDRGPRISESRESREVRDGREVRRPQPSAASRPASEGEERRREPGILEAGGLVALPDTPRRTYERFPPAEGPQAEAAKRATELLLRVAGLDLAPRVLQGEDRLEVDLAGEDVDWCFADDGELVMAIEHLLPRLIRTLSGEAVMVRVDCDNFQEIREERLRSLAQQMAEEVRRFGKPRTLEPLNPADRRVVHVTLADDPHVITESEGDGYFKRITIRPA